MANHCDIRVSLVALLMCGVLGACGYHRSESFVDEAANAKKVEVKPEGEIVAAVAADDADLLVKLLETGVDVNYRFADGQTLLIRAVSLAKIKITRILLEKGADPSLADGEGKKPCDHTGGVSELKQLLQCPVDPAVIQEAFEAVRTGNVRKAQGLLRDGVDPNLRDGAGETLLIAAVKNAQAKIVDMMIRGFRAKGLDLDLRDTQGKTALAWARELNQSSIIRLLESSGAKE